MCGTGGHDAGSEGLNRHLVSINADAYTPVDETSLIPTGQIASVNSTLFDMRVPQKLGDRLPLMPGGDNNGYDHNFCINQNQSQEMRYFCCSTSVLSNECVLEWVNYFLELNVYTT